jgi:hypothetical protein
VAPPTPTHAATPLRDISLHVSQPGQERVEVRVVQQAGEVRVAVRTGDTELASGLRQGVHELVGKLEDNGFHAEAWRPGGGSIATPGISQPAESRSAFSQQQPGGGSQGRQDSPQQESGQRNQNSSNRPQWVEELESSVQSGDATGDTNGIGS